MRWQIIKETFRSVEMVRSPLPNLRKLQACVCVTPPFYSHICLLVLKVLGREPHYLRLFSPNEIYQPSRASILHHSRSRMVKVRLRLYNSTKNCSVIVAESPSTRFHSIFTLNLGSRRINFSLYWTESKKSTILDKNETINFSKP